MKLNYKQKILLALLSLFKDKELSLSRLHKLAFLISRKMQFYDFVPYGSSPYSFEMENDLSYFAERDLITIQDQNILPKQLSVDLFYEALIPYVEDFINLNERELADYIHKNFPFYAQSYKRKAEPAIYTIGYQGYSIDGFINALLKYGIECVIDVRNTPMSRKYGFNSLWLSRHLPEFKIRYIGMPELGVERKIRYSMEKHMIWSVYEKGLEDKMDYISKVIKILKSTPSVLMCFEKRPEDCHRHLLAKKIKELSNMEIINL